MDASRKALTDFEWKAEREGSFKAVISTFNTVDKDGDVTLPGAFAPGMRVVLSPWGHSSMDGALPVGTATISSDGSRAIADGQFLVNTPHGKAAYQTVKELSDQGIQQWSYGYRVKQVGEKKDLAAWPGAKRILKEVQPFEVSPVLLGAGEGVFTQSIKSETADDPFARFEQIARDLQAFLNESKAGASISRSNWTRLHSAVSELMAFLTENNPDGHPAKDAETDEAIDAIWTRIHAEEARTSLVDLSSLS